MKTMPARLTPENFNLHGWTRGSVIGHLYKGSPKPKENAVGKDLGPEMRFKPTNAAVFGDDILHETYKSRWTGQGIDKQLCIDVSKTPLDIYFPSQVWWENFFVGYGEMSATGLKRFCDGQTILAQKKSLQRGKTQSFYLESVRQPCPNAELPIPCPQCGYLRRLSFYLEKLYLKQVTGVCLLNTRSIYEVAIKDQIQAGEEMLKGLGADISKIPEAIASIPETRQYVRWKLGRSIRRINKVIQGNQSPADEWMISLSVDPEWIQLVQERMGRGRFVLVPGNLIAKSLAEIQFEDQQKRMSALLEFAQQVQALSPATQALLLSGGQPLPHPQAALPPQIDVLPHSSVVIEHEDGELIDPSPTTGSQFFRKTEMWWTIEAEFQKAKTPDRVGYLANLARARIQAGKLPISAEIAIQDLADKAYDRINDAMGYPATIPPPQQPEAISADAELLPDDDDPMNLDSIPY